MSVVKNNQAQHRYEVYESGDLVGFVQYSMREDEMWIHYTQLKRRHRSDELIEELLQHVLDEALRRRLAIMPFCRALRTLVNEKPEYAHLIPEPWRARFLGNLDPQRRPTTYVRYTGSPKRRSTAKEDHTQPVPLAISRGKHLWAAPLNSNPLVNGIPDNLSTSGCSGNGGFS